MQRKMKCRGSIFLLHLRRAQFIDDLRLFLDGMTRLEIVCMCRDEIIILASLDSTLSIKPPEPHLFA